MTIGIGSAAPEFTLAADPGESTSLAALTANGSVLLAFFKTTCPTCRLAFPVFGELHERYGDVVPVVAISQDPVAKARPWLDDLGFHGPVLDDETDAFAVSASYAIEAVPTTVLVGGDRTVVTVGVGWNREAVNDLARTLGEITGRTTAPVSTENDGRPPFKPG